MRVLVSLFALVAATQAFAPSPVASRTATTISLNAAMDRRQVVATGIAVSLATLVSNTPAALAAGDTLPNGVTYTVQKKGTGPAPEKGELAAIRFKAQVKDGKMIDDIFETAEPYYTRVGSGGMLPGVEGALPYMHLGDRWILEIPVCRDVCNALSKRYTYKCVLTLSPTLLLHIYSPPLRLVPRDDRHRQESQGFQVMPPSFSRWKWWDCLERNRNLLNSLETIKRKRK